MTDPTDHPRPLLRRRWTSLDGEWGFTAGPEELPGPSAFDRPITVPFAPEAPASGIGTRDRLGPVWYRRELDGSRHADGRRTLLHLGAVDRLATVFADGRAVAHHEGGYDEVVADVTGASVVVVRADDDPDDLDAPRGKQEWRDEPHSIWYPRTTGIWRTAWLEEVPATAISALEWVTDTLAMTVTMRVRIEGHVRPGTSVRFRLRHGSRLVAEASASVLQPEVEVTTRIGDGGIDDRWGLQWFPRRPVLLDADVEVVDGAGGIIDAVESYTALRTVDVRDGMVCLNGCPYPLRLVLDQGYWPETGLTPPDGAALRRDVELTLALGFNGARKHQKVEDPRWFAWADRLGLLTWVELPSAYRPGATASSRLLAEWARIVAAHRNHPSVIAWVPINESWGVPAAASDPRQRALIEALSAATDALDGTRPVSPNDGWETTGGSIVGVHDYTQDAAVLAARFADAAAVDAVLTGGLPSGHRVDLDGWGAEGRAVVLSEFGGVALADDEEATWGYQRASSPDDLLERYRSLWAAVHESTALAGACWTQLTDTYQEANGLLRMDRTPKVPLEAFAAATRGKRA